MLTSARHLVWLATWCWQASDGYEVARTSDTEAAAADGDGWEDDDNWDSFEVTPPKSSAKSTV